MPRKPLDTKKGALVAQKGGDILDETNNAAVQRTTRKLLARAEALLDDPEGFLSTADLARIAATIEDAAAVLGVRPKLDEDEQRAKIAQLLRRAGDGKEDPSPVEVTFAPEAQDASF